MQSTARFWLHFCSFPSSELQGVPSLFDVWRPVAPPTCRRNCWNICEKNMSDRRNHRIFLQPFRCLAPTRRRNCSSKNMPDPGRPQGPSLNGSSAILRIFHRRRPQSFRYMAPTRRHNCGNICHKNMSDRRNHRIFLQRLLKVPSGGLREYILLPRRNGALAVTTRCGHQLLGRPGKGCLAQ